MARFGMLSWCFQSRDIYQTRHVYTLDRGLSLDSNQTQVAWSYDLAAVIELHVAQMVRRLNVFVTTKGKDMPQDLYISIKLLTMG